MSRKPIDSSLYDANNLAYARIVLADPERHGTLIKLWAKAVVTRLEGAKSEELRPEGQNNESSHS